MLSAQLKPDAGVDEIVDAALSRWEAIGWALAPIVGHRGVAALYHRSLKLTTRTHPWLAGVSAGPLASVDLPALKAVLLQQTPQRALEGSEALFETFRELLASLVGSPLTERLLRTVWNPPAGAVPEQDIPT